MTSMLAIVSKSVFAQQFGKNVEVGDVLPLDVYRSKSKAFGALDGDLYLVTVRPGDTLWLVGVLRGPQQIETGFMAAKNTEPVTDVTGLVASIRFTTGKGINAAPGKLGMSLQTPRQLSDADVVLLGGSTSSTRTQPVSKSKSKSNKLAVAQPTGDSQGELLAFALQSLETSPAAALAKLVAVWQRTQWSRIANLVHTITCDHEPEASQALRTSPCVDHKAWLGAAKDASLIQRGALAATAAHGSSKQVAARFKAMAPWNDPRATAAGINLVPQPIWTSTGAGPVWTAIYKVLREAPDPRLLPVVEAMDYVEDRLAKVVVATKALAHSGDVDAEYEATVRALEDAAARSKPDQPSSASVEARDVDDSALPSVWQIRGWAAALEAPIPCARIGDRTLFGAVRDLPGEQRPRRFDTFFVIGDNGQRLWAVATANGVAALSPGGSRVAVLSSHRVDADHPGRNRVYEGDEVLRLRVHEIGDSQRGDAERNNPLLADALPMLDAPLVPPLSHPEAPWKYKTAVRALAFVDETTLAVLGGFDGEREEERMLLWTYGIDTGTWRCLRDETSIQIDALRMFRTTEGHLVVHGHEVDRFTPASVRTFALHNGQWKLRQSYQQAETEGTEGLSRARGSWVVPHPETGFVAQRFGADGHTNAPTRDGAFVHVDPSTGHGRPIGPTQRGERPALSQQGELYAYRSHEWPRPGSGKHSVLDVRRVGGEIDDEARREMQVPRPHYADACLPGYVTVSTVGTTCFVDVESWQPARTIAVNSAVVDELHVCPDGTGMLARTGGRGFFTDLTATTVKVRKAGPVATTVEGLSIWLNGNALEFKRGSKNVLKLKDLGVPCYGCPDGPGVFSVKDHAVYLVRVDLEGGVVQSRETFNPGGSPVALHCDPTANLVVVGTADGALALFRTGRSAPIVRVEVRSGHPVEQVGLHADGSRALSLCEGRLRWHDLASGSTEVVEPPQGQLWAGLACHPSRPWAAVVDTEGRVSLLHTSAKAGRDTRTDLGMHVPGTHRLAFFEDGLLVGGGRAQDEHSVVLYEFGGCS